MASVVPVIAGDLSNSTHTLTCSGRIVCGRTGAVVDAALAPFVLSRVELGAVADPGVGGVDSEAEAPEEPARVALDLVPLGWGVADGQRVAVGRGHLLRGSTLLRSIPRRNGVAAAR